MIECNFPVRLEEVQLAGTNIKVPKARAVVRTDMPNPLPIAMVSDKYKLITHEAVRNAALGFIGRFGQPQEKIVLGSNGARMLATYTYREPRNQAEVMKDDIVGLQIHVENSYNTLRKITFRVGALRLWCLNGAVMYLELGTFHKKHVGNTEIALPDPESVTKTFEGTIQDYRKFATIDLGDQYNQVAQKAVEDHAVPEKALLSLGESKGTTAWHLYNDFTFHVNHRERASASPVGRISRLARIDRWFKTTKAFH